MDKKKHIEEIAKAIFANCHCGLFEDEAYRIAEFVIEEQGYCKVSEVINKFSEELIKRFNDLEYNANTPRKTVKVDELRAQMDWILHEVAINTIKEFTEKYVEALK